PASAPWLPSTRPSGPPSTRCCSSSATSTRRFLPKLCDATSSARDASRAPHSTHCIAEERRVGLHHYLGPRQAESSPQHDLGSTSIAIRGRIACRTSGGLLVRKGMTTS